METATTSPSPAAGLERRETAILAAATLATLALHLALRGPATALAVGFFLVLVVTLGWGVPRTLGAPRAARAASGTILVLALALAFAPEVGGPEIERVTSVLRFPDPRARAFHELAPPADWRGRGRAFAYVGIDGDVAQVLSAGPILELDGRRLSLERPPERGGYLRAPFPEEKLGADSVDLAFGLERPALGLGLQCTTFVVGSLSRAPSRYSPDGAPPPRGPPLVPRPGSLWDGLLGRARFEQPREALGPGVAALGRYAIEVWLLDPADEVLETCR